MKCNAFMEPERPLPCSENLTIGPCPEPVESVHILTPYYSKIHFNKANCLPIFACVFQLVSSLQVFKIKILSVFLLSPMRATFSPISSSWFNPSDYVLGEEYKLQIAHSVIEQTGSYRLPCTAHVSVWLILGDTLLAAFANNDDSCECLGS
jgi:hypothetical protein